MSQVLAQPENCGGPCAAPLVTNIPGIPGVCANPCVDGIPGFNAFDYVANYSPSAQPVMPYPIQILSVTLASGSAVAHPAATSTIVPAMRVSGTGIQAGTTVQSVDSGTQITLSLQATASGVKSLTFEDQVTIATTTSTAFLTPGEIAFVKNWGYMKVLSLLSAKSVQLENIQNASTGAYPGNSAQGTILAAANAVVPGGLQGPTGNLSGAAGGSLAGNYPNPTVANNVIASINMTNTGVGAVTVGDSTHVPQVHTDAAGRITAMPSIAIAFPSLSAYLTAASAAGITANKIQYGTGANTVGLTDLTAFVRTLLAAADAAAFNALLKTIPRYGMIGSLTAVLLNAATTDYAFTVSSGRYRVDKITIENASANINLATAGVFTGAGGTGVVFAADQSLAALTGATKFIDLALQTIVTTNTQTAGTIRFRVGTPQAGADTVNVFCFGWIYD